MESRSRDSEVEFKIERHLPGSVSSMMILRVFGVFDLLFAFFY